MPNEDTKPKHTSTQAHTLLNGNGSDWYRNQVESKGFCLIYLCNSRHVCLRVYRDDTGLVFPPNLVPAQSKSV